uniref:Uncharacterized protein n=1 Tax=Amphimedon queenslandica TaxID=400682 RepID=A0A1X7UWX9_AMPQE
MAKPVQEIAVTSLLQVKWQQHLPWGNFQLATTGDRKRERGNFLCSCIKVIKFEEIMKN